MADEIFVEAAPGETRAALVRGDELRRLVIERSGAGVRAGDIVFGRVETVSAALNAAFVAVGDGPAGLLNAADAAPLGGPAGPIGGRVGVGDAVVVQVATAAAGGKGPKLTMRLRLTGRWLVHLPGDRGIAWSKRLAADQRPPAITAALAGLPGGWIVRSAAADGDPSALAAEARRLLDAARAIEAAAGRERAPLRLHAGPDPVAALIGAAAAGGPVARIVVDGGPRLAALKAALPDLAGQMVAHNGAAMLFATTGLDAAIEALLEPALTLTGGGRVTLTPTPALLAIDIDSGAATGGSAAAVAEAVNHEAMAAIAQRVQLADLAGAMVIDPLPLPGRAARQRLVDALRRAFSDDDRDVTIAGYTALGRIELIRPRTGPSILEQLTDPCPWCAGAARTASATTTALTALRAVVGEDRARPGRAWRLSVAPPVAALLTGLPARGEAESRLGRGLDVVADDRIGADGWRIDPAPRPALAAGPGPGASGHG